MKRLKCVIVLVSGILWLSGCAAPEEPPVAGFEPEVEALPADPSDYAPISTYEAMDIPADNPLTPEKAALGRQLFFDSRLSGDGSRSCYACHLCENGLAENKPTAVGAFNRQLTRNSPTLWNIGYHREFYWDGRAKSLEAQAMAAWTGGNMGADAEKVAAELNQVEGYRQQFQAVFSSPPTPENVTRALAAYMRTIVSHDAPFDRWQGGDESAVGDEAKRGYEVFKKAQCTNCHDGVLLTDLQYHNVGIGMDAEEPDSGRVKVTQEAGDTGAFKTPTLRDVSQSAPYFHDGSVATLEEAVDLMLGGGLDNPHLDRTNLKKASVSEQEKADLIEFLKSLDQPCTISAPRLP